MSNMSRATFYNPEWDTRDPAHSDCDCGYCVLQKFGVIGADVKHSTMPTADVIAAGNPVLLRDAAEIVEAALALTLQRAMEIFGAAHTMNLSLLSTGSVTNEDVMGAFDAGVKMVSDLFAGLDAIGTLIKATHMRNSTTPKDDAQPAGPVESIKTEGELESLTQKLLGRD